jgi:hypothetical protein
MKKLTDDFGKQHNQNSFSSICNSDKHPHDFIFLLAIQIQLIVQLAASLLEQLHAKLA